MTDFSHLDAIQERLHRARQRLASATAKARDWHAHEVMMIEREEAAEYAFLGIKRATIDDVMADDDLLAELAETLGAVDFDDVAS